MFEIPDPDNLLTASDVKDVAEEVITPLLLPGVEGSPLDPGDIWSVVILACVNQTSIWDTCNDTDGTPCDDTVLTWLHTLNRQWLEFVANLLLARLAMTILDPDRSRIVSIDFINNPYHGEHHIDEGELCSTAPKDGTTTCHRYCTAYVVSNGKPVTLAMTYVRNDEDEADAVERVLARVENYPFDIELLLADSGFYNERVIRRAREIAATVVHVPKKGERMKEKLDVHKSYMTTYRMFKDSERELCFPLAVAVSYQNGDRGKHGEVVRGYVACGVAEKSPKQVERLYRKRSGIETTYRLLRQARRITTTHPVVRFAIMLVAALLENLWLVLRWVLVARPQRGGRELPKEFTFKTFCDWIRKELEEELERRWYIEANDVGVPETYGSVAAAG